MSDIYAPDNNIRPYTSGKTDHEDGIATIVLFQDYAVSSSDVTDSASQDYINDLGNTVVALTTLSSKNGEFGSPEEPTGFIPLLDMSGRPENPYYGVFNNFSITSFTESHSQIVKVHMNFSASWNAFFIGETPKVYQFSGVFLDTKEYPYYQEFMVAYSKFFSGRKSIENNFQTKIMIAGQIIDGYILDISVTHEAQSESLKQFRFTVLVKGSSWMRVNYANGQLWTNGMSNTERMKSNNFQNMLSNSKAVSGSTNSNDFIPEPAAEQDSPSIPVEELDRSGNQSREEQMSGEQFGSQ